MQMRFFGSLLNALVGLVVYADPIIIKPDCLNNKNAERSLFLWSLESPNLNAKSYLFGTIHVPYTLVWDYVSHTVKTAFSKAESIVFELDLYDPATVDLLTRCKRLPSGQTIQELLPPTLFARLKNYMRRFRDRLASMVYDSSIAASRKEAKRRANQLYLNIAGGWERRRPVWLLFLLQQLGELQTSTSADGESNARGSGEPPTPMLDVFLAQEAQTSAKQLYSIETPDECNPLNRINMEQVIFAINYTLSYLEFVRDRHLDDHRARRSGAIAASSSGGALHDLIEQYKCGNLQPDVFDADAQRFAQIGFSLSPADDQRAQQFDRELRDEIISKRNVRMASRVNSLLIASPSTAFFFALGAGHFLGDDSILSLLEREGYSITAVREGDAIDKWPSLAWHASRASRIRQLWVRDEEIPLPQAENTVFEVEISVSSGSTIRRDALQIVAFLICVLFANRVLLISSSSRVF